MTTNCTNCSHGLADHKALAPQCSAPRCTCIRYRAPAIAPGTGSLTPRTAPAPIPPALSTPAARRDVDPPSPAGPPRPTVDELVQACLRSDNKRTRALGPKLLELAEKVRGALRNEREAAEAKIKQAEELAAKKAAVDKLTKQLAAAKAELRRVKPAGAGNGLVGDGSRFQCDECHAAFTTPQGRGAHAFRAHGRRKGDA